MWRLFTAGLPQDVLEPARELNRQLDLGNIDYPSFKSKIIALTGKGPIQVESLKSSQIVKNTPLISYIAELKQQYKIGLLSNIASNWIQSSLLTPKEYLLFDDVILSFQVGLIKPDPKIFKLACKRLKVEPNEVVLVDDIQNNCIAATTYGLHAICYQEFDRFKADFKGLSVRCN